MRADSLTGLETVKAAAERLSASRRYVYLLRDRGQLEFVYLGDQMPRIRKSDLARLEAEGVRGRKGRGRKVSDVERLLTQRDCGQVTS